MRIIKLAQIQGVLLKVHNFKFQKDNGKHIYICETKSFIGKISFCQLCLNMIYLGHLAAMSFV